MAARLCLAWKFTRRLCIESIAKRGLRRVEATTHFIRQFGLGAISSLGSNFLGVPAVKTTKKKIMAMPTRRAIKSVIAFLVLMVFDLGFQAYPYKIKLAFNLA